MGEWAEGYDAGYATGTADGAKATNDFTKRRIKELEADKKYANEMWEHSVDTNDTCRNRIDELETETELCHSELVRALNRITKLEEKLTLADILIKANTKVGADD